MCFIIDPDGKCASGKVEKFKQDCSARGYTQTCTGNGQVGVGGSCDGKYKKCQCKSAYQYTKPANDAVYDYKDSCTDSEGQTRYKYKVCKAIYKYLPSDEVTKVSNAISTGASLSSATECKNPAIVTGGSCPEISAGNVRRATACVCEETKYPYTTDYAKQSKAFKNGESCTGPDNITHYKAPTCSGATDGVGTWRAICASGETHDVTKDMTTPVKCYYCKKQICSYTDYNDCYLKNFPNADYGGTCRLDTKGCYYPDEVMCSERNSNWLDTIPNGHDKYYHALGEADTSLFHTCYKLKTCEEYFGAGYYTTQQSCESVNGSGECVKVSEGPLSCYRPSCQKPRYYFLQDPCEKELRGYYSYYPLGWTNKDGKWSYDSWRAEERRQKVMLSTCEKRGDCYELVHKTCAEMYLEDGGASSLWIETPIAQCSLTCKVAYGVSSYQECNDNKGKYQTCHAKQKLDKQCYLAENTLCSDRGYRSYGDCISESDAYIAQCQDLGGTNCSPNFTCEELRVDGVWEVCAIWKYKDGTSSGGSSGCANDMTAAEAESYCRSQGYSDTFVSQDPNYVYQVCPCNASFLK